MLQVTVVMPPLLHPGPAIGMALISTAVLRCDL